MLDDMSEEYVFAFGYTILILILCVKNKRKHFLDITPKQLGDEMFFS